jgi:DNA-directed RNA polymerase II subunit RPB2
MIQQDIPLIILMRALNIIGDKQILDLIIYDSNDSDMMDMLRASLEEAQTIRTQEDALDYISKRSKQPQHEKQLRIGFATLLLEGDFLPHVSTQADGALKKAYFVGYMTNRMLTGALGRSTEDDRDYYGKKRLDMAGMLLAQIFRQQFKKYTDDMKKYIEKELNSSNVKTITLANALKHEIITRGIKSALSTGNWGKDKHDNV